MSWKPSIIHLYTETSIDDNTYWWYNILEHIGNQHLAVIDNVLYIHANFNDRPIHSLFAGVNIISMVLVVVKQSVV